MVPEPEISDTEIKSLSFEQALKELENLVRCLDAGQMSLEEMIAACERGTTLKAHCDAKLAQGRTKIEQIIVSSDNTVTTEELTI